MSNIEEKVENLVKKPIEDLGYSLYDVQYVKEGQDYYLRIFIEKPNGSIDLNDCEKVNDGINDLLDKANYIKEQYFLEVSSTGLEKVLRRDEHLKQNIGKEVEVKLFKAVDAESNAGVADIRDDESKSNVHQGENDTGESNMQQSGKDYAERNNIKRSDEDSNNVETSVEENNKSKQNKKNKKQKKSKNSKQKEIIGILESFDKGKVTLRLEDEKTIDLERSNISQMKLVFDWDSLG